MIQKIVIGTISSLMLASGAMAQTNDWASSAVQNLNTRYKCLVGYPDGQIRPNQTPTRDEMFALVNHCLNNITTYYTRADEQLAASLRSQILKVNQRISTEVQRQNLQVGNYVGVAYAANAANYPTVGGNRAYESGVTLQSRVVMAENSRNYALSARPYVTFTSSPAYVGTGVQGGALLTVDVPVARRILANRTTVSSANLYLGAGGQLGSNQDTGIGVVGLEARLRRNVVLFADAKIPFTETGAPNPDQGYNVTGTVGLGVKF